MRKCLNAAAAYMLRWTAQSSQSMLEGQSSAAVEQSGGRAGTQWSEQNRGPEFGLALLLL